MKRSQVKMVSAEKHSIKNWMDEGNIDKLRSVDSQSYERYNPMYHAAQNCKPGNSRALEILKYFVEERQLHCDTALTRALQCGHFAAADYLYDPTKQVHNAIYSIEAMEWAAAHGGIFDASAIFEITDCWNGSDVDERLKLLASLCSEMSERCDKELVKRAAESEAEVEWCALNPHDCINCEDGCDGTVCCGCCALPLCDKCGTRGEACIFKTEWLTNIGNTCEACDTLVCGDCLKVCYECANAGEETYLCANCSPELEVTCKHHKWQYCGKHEKPVACGTCHANRNYSKKMQGW